MTNSTHASRGEWDKETERIDYRLDRIVVDLPSQTLVEFTEPAHMTRIETVKCLMLMFLLGLANGCRSLVPGSPADPGYVAEIEQWHQKRIASLTSQDGWLNLVGLFWLKEGENSFGADPSNTIVFPPGNAPDVIGSFFLQDGIVRVRINPGAGVTYEGKPVGSMRLKTDAEGDQTVLKRGSLSWYIIDREGSLGVRLRDSNSPRLGTFRGIERYPVDPAWRVEAFLERYDPPKVIPVPTVLGNTMEQTSPGTLMFRIDGHEYRLDPLAGSNESELFVIFADETNTDETYPAGRFLYVRTPGEDGKTVIDFNKAYNPPCAFSEFATCPLPPAQNRLPLFVRAGEKKYEGGDH